jgi:hypothetical protein
MLYIVTTRKIWYAWLWAQQGSSVDIGRIQVLSRACVIACELIGGIESNPAFPEKRAKYEVERVKEAVCWAAAVPRAREITLLLLRQERQGRRGGRRQGRCSD